MWQNQGFFHRRPPWESVWIFTAAAVSGPLVSLPVKMTLLRWSSLEPVIPASLDPWGASTVSRRPWRQVHPAFKSAFESPAIPGPPREQTPVRRHRPPLRVSTLFPDIETSINSVLGMRTISPLSRYVRRGVVVLSIGMNVAAAPGRDNKQSGEQVVRAHRNQHSRNGRGQTLKSAAVGKCERIE